MLVYVNRFHLSEVTSRTRVIEHFVAWLNDERADIVALDALLMSGTSNLKSGAAITVVDTDTSPWLYSLRFTYPDSKVRNRLWSLEIGMTGPVPEHATNLTIRVATEDGSTRARASSLDEICPPIVRSMDSRGFFSPLTPGARVRSVADARAAELFKITVHAPDREFVCVVISADSSGRMAIDPDLLRAHVVGLAEVVTIPVNAHEAAIRRVLGGDFSAWMGAINIILAPREGAPYARTVKLLPNELASMPGGSAGVIQRILEVITDRANPVMEPQHISPAHVQRVREGEDQIKVRRLIAAGESSTVEYKATLRWNIDAGMHDVNTITHSVLKTIAAFMNTDGGTLLIGVTDAGGFFGLDADGFDNDDAFLRFLMDKARSALGSVAAAHLNPAVVKMPSGSVCVVECTRSEELVYVKKKDSEICYARQGPTTVPIAISGIVAYDRSRRFR